MAKTGTYLIVDKVNKAQLELMSEQAGMNLSCVAFFIDFVTTSVSCLPWCVVCSSNQNSELSDNQQFFPTIF